MEDGQEFHHVGALDSATFEVTLRKYPGAEGFTELTKYASATVQKSLEQIHLPPNYYPIAPAEHFLVTDVTHPAEGLEVTGTTRDSVVVPEAILDSLRLNTTKGVVRFTTYHWRSGPPNFSGSSRPLSAPFNFSFLGLGPSVFATSAFDRCRTIADILMIPWDDSSTFDRVLKMAMSYHDVTYTFKEPKHGFLLLMIIFEALFKGRDEDTPIAVPRLAELLARDKNERKLIIRKFRQGDSNYIRTRDSIAHGDVSLNSAAVKLSYPGLYNYVTKAITQLLLLRDCAIDPSKDFYEEISRISKERFNDVQVAPGLAQ